MNTLSEVKDFFSIEIQNILQSLNTNLGQNFVAVFELKSGLLVAFYAVQSIIVQDEQNRKTFLIKGKFIGDLASLLQQGRKIVNGNWSGDIKAIVESLPVCTHTFSDNMFGFIGFGIQGY